MPKNSSMSTPQSVSRWPDSPASFSENFALPPGLTEARARVTFLCGFGHVTASVLLGLLGFVFLGWGAMIVVAVAQGGTPGAGPWTLAAMNVLTLGAVTWYGTTRTRLPWRSVLRLQRLRRLPPWQRAVVWAEILGPPRGLQ